MVSEAGFGAWAIGGPAMAGDIAIGWGKTDDDTSIKALKKAADLGVNFFDTADFYGLGHSEELIGKVFGKGPSIIVATKVGHRLASDNSIFVDYSKNYILRACEKSLKRLKREYLDYYQLHTAKVHDLENSECIEAMESLKKQGKIRYWGVSLNTYDPYPEADFLIKNSMGSGFQIVFNILNQRARKLLDSAYRNEFGIIARMPLQFGLLANKFRLASKFSKNDHRAFRLNKRILKKVLPELKKIWPVKEHYNITPVSLSLSFIMSFKEVSTVIPGIKNADQAFENATGITVIKEEDKRFLVDLYDHKLWKLVEFLEKEEI